MTGKRNQSALLAKYYGLYKKNPRSKVFAPLAEAFRKLGMIDDALKILKEGIRHHPNYALGYIVLSHCYYDLEKYELTYNTLRPIISQNADNISLQKIFAQACIHMGHLEEALDTYKYLLFLSPRDKFFATEVKKLEDDLMVGHKKLTLDQLIKAPDMVIPVSDTVDDDWVQVDFNRNQKKALPENEKKPEREPEQDEWVMRRPGEDEKTSSLHPILNKESVSERSLDDDFYADEFEEEMGDIDEVNSTINTDSPIVSHTLIDLYCSQHYYDKAIELLDKILELNPQDQNSIRKMNEVREMKRKHSPEQKVTEQSGHDELISIIESQVKAKSPAEIKVKEAFDDFLVNLRVRAQRT
ncbi:MAG: CDC27 family protein [Bdellovibrionota bacterium]